MRRDSKTEEENERSKKIYDTYSTKAVEKMVLMDSKNFTVETTRSGQNDIPVKLYGLRTKSLYRGFWHGKTRIHFIDSNTTKVNSENYIKLNNRGILRNCKRLYLTNNFIFQQDGTTSHTSHRYLEDAAPAFTKNVHRVRTVI